jgi:hypothetical protein
MRKLLANLALALGVVLPVISTPSPAHAQLVRPGEAPPDGPIDDAGKKSAVQGLARMLRQRYVFPDVGERYASALLKKLAAGGYRATTAVAFADAINADLQAVQKDKHLRVRFDPSFRPRNPDAEPTADEKARFREAVARQNYGVEKIERLAGNIGYIDLRNFHQVDLSAPSLSAAMALVAATDALIIDLRQNGGGDPATVAFLCSYFFADHDGVHINDIYDRPGNTTHQYWSVPVPGVRYLGKAVYVLTSARTFSGAEEFSYDLQSLKRATLIGETTGGGAHPGDVISVGAGFVAFVPTGRAINPITHTNWEGVGVKPDVASAAPQALQTAHLMALRARLKDEQDPERRSMLERAIQKVETGEPAAPAGHP